jgi:hypothetical protein
VVNNLMIIIHTLLGCGIGALLLGGLGVLSIYGLITPFVAASVSTFLCYFLRLSLETSLFVVIAVYLGCTLLQSSFAMQDLSSGQTVLLQNEPVTSLDDYERRDAAGNTVLMVLGLLAITLLPIPSLPKFSGPIVFLFAAGLTLYASSRRDGMQSFGIGLTVVGIQSILLLILVKLMGESLNPILGLISCMSLPSILLSRPVLSNPKQAGSESTAVFFVVLTVLIALITPGYSLSCIVAGFFPNDTARTRYLSFLNGCMEGWVFNQLCRSSISGKTPLGDILSQRPFLLGDNEVSLGFTFIVVVSLVFTFAFSYFLWQLAMSKALPYPSRSSYRYCIGLSLIIQSVFAIGLWTLPLLGVASFMWFLRSALMPEDKDSFALSFLVPISFG